ncbi:MAG: hypothetical protein V1720_17520 [bacterium]
MDDQKLEHFYRMKETIAFCQGYFTAIDQTVKIIGKLDEIKQFISSQINAEKDK